MRMKERLGRGGPGRGDGRQTKADAGHGERNNDEGIRVWRTEKELRRGTISFAHLVVKDLSREFQ